MRCLFVVSALLLSAFVEAAFAEGAYQPTKDRKTLVWNNYPQPGDAATWSGKRDADGYATGYGTLIWFATEKKIVTGSNLPQAKSTIIGRYSGNMVRGKLDGPVVNVDAHGKKFHDTFVDGRKASDWSAGPAPAPGPQRNERVQRETVAEPPAPAEGPSPVAQQSPNQQISKPVVRETPKPIVDDSLQSLVGPSSFARMNSGPDASPEPSTASSSTAHPRLSEAEVVTLADAQARTQGYDLAEYQRSQARYTTADNTWWISYDQKAVSADGMSETGKHFSVSVEDKTKKVSILAER